MRQDEQQFSQMVKDNRGTIYSVCYMFSNDADEVADLFQEVLVRLWSGFATFHGQSETRTWIYRVALNTCISIDRKKKRRKKAMLSMDVDYLTARLLSFEKNGLRLCFIDKISGRRIVFRKQAAYMCILSYLCIRILHNYETLSYYFDADAADLSQNCGTGNFTKR